MYILPCLIVGERVKLRFLKNLTIHFTLLGNTFISFCFKDLDKSHYPPTLQLSTKN